MRSKIIHDVTRLRDRRGNPETLFMEEEAAKVRLRVIAVLRVEIKRTNSRERAVFAAYLMDVGIEGCGRLQAAEVAALIGAPSPVSVRVLKHSARQAHPCGGGSRSCGKDVTDCAHDLGAKVCRRAFWRARNALKPGELELVLSSKG